MGNRAARPTPHPTWRRTLKVSLVLGVLAALAVAAFFGLRQDGPGEHTGPAVTAARRAGSSPDTTSVGTGSSQNPQQTQSASPGTEPRRSHPRSQETVEPKDPSKGSAVRPGAPPPAVVSKDGVRVKQPVPKPSGSAMWVAIEIANREQSPASYKVEIRVTGPEGFSATVRTTSGVLAPGATASQVLTAMDSSGAHIPKHPRVEIIRVTRTPA